MRCEGRRSKKRKIPKKGKEKKTHLSLKDMKKPEPMPDFMRSRAPQIKVPRAPARETVCEDLATVLIKRGTASRGVGGERADTQQAAAKVGKEVDVEVGVVAFPEGGFHLGVGVAGGPGVVDGEVCADEGEGDSLRAVGVVHVGEL